MDRTVLSRSDSLDGSACECAERSLSTARRVKAVSVDLLPGSRLTDEKNVRQRRWRFERAIHPRPTRRPGRCARKGLGFLLLERLKVALGGEPECCGVAPEEQHRPILELVRSAPEWLWADECAVRAVEVSKLEPLRSPADECVRP